MLGVHLSVHCKVPVWGKSGVSQSYSVADRAGKSRFFRFWVFRFKKHPKKFKIYFFRILNFFSQFLLRKLSLSCFLR